MSFGITITDIRNKIIRILATEGKQTLTELCRHECFRLMAIKAIRVALEELRFERMIEMDENERYSLINNNFVCNEIQ